MSGNNYTTLNFKDVAKNNESFALPNFIVSDSTKVPQKILINHPYDIDGIVMGFCTKGSATIKVNLKEFELHENSIFMILPNQILETIDKTDDFFVNVLVFSLDFFVDSPLPKDFDVVDKMVKHPCVKLSDKEMQYLLELHAFAIKSFKRKKHIYTDEITKHLLSALIKEVTSVYSDISLNGNGKPSSRNEDLAELFFKLLFEYYTQERTVSFYADKLCITPKYLSRVLKKVTGNLISTWIDRVVTMRIKIMLRSTDLTVLQISEELNFPNSSFLCKFFKKHTSLTPLEYRESKM